MTSADQSTVQGSQPDSETPAKLGDDAIGERLADVPEWTEVNGELQRTFKFADFAESMQFVNRVADAAESAQHHPDILIRYNKVTLTVSTHDAGGITGLDFDLASKCDSFFSRED